MPDTPDLSEPLQRRLRAETEGEVHFDAASRGRHATDASIYQIQPLGVFIPRTERDVETAIAIARELKVPIVPRGAATSQAGQAIGEGLLIDGSRHLRSVLDIDVANRRATVQPGVVLDELNALLRPHGLWFPVDIDSSAQATLGGMAGNNAGGVRSIAHGSMVHNVLGASAWLSSGELLDFGPVDGLDGRSAEIADYLRGLAAAHQAELAAHWPRLRHRSCGYNLDLFDCRSERPYTADGSANLAHLLIGSEGTLAYTRSLTLQLAELPRSREMALVDCPDVAEAMAMVPRIMKTLEPSALELLDASMTEGRAGPQLLVEFSGDERPGRKTRLAELVHLLGEMGHHEGVRQVGGADAQARVWAARAAGLRGLPRVRGPAKPAAFIDGCVIPLKHLAEYTEALTQLLARHGSRIAWHGHAGAGVLHPRPLLDMRKAGGQGGTAQMRKIAEETSALVRKYQGVFGGQGGDGIARSEWIEWQFGPKLKDAFRALKNHVDPAFLFNPGKIVIPARIDDPKLLRFPPRGAPAAYRTIELKPLLDWGGKAAAGEGGSTGGLAEAVEMCDGNGQCRQRFDAGAMCPSYQLTQEERDLPRGRANTLRLALSGQLEGGLGGEAVDEALALCVGCKACRRECPNGVDMARMKIEARAQRAAGQPPSRRERLFAALPEHVGRRVALMNLRNRWPFAARLGEKYLGIAAQRPLPRWRKDTFWRTAEATLFAGLDATLAAAPKAAVLFVDTFNGGFETENARAAARVLKAAGYTLHQVKKGGDHPHCCGRTWLAGGQVEQARARLGALIAALLPLARAGVPIVGLEPACLLTLRDEALALGLGESAEIVASQALLFEEFVAREARAGRFALDLKPAGAPILLHGHCHSKAFGAVAPMLDVLRLIPGAAPRLIESSCCGMAGGFGYEAEHHAMSLRMAELKLLPAIRAEPDAILVADGSSCRQQIAHGTQREALHVARLLERLMVPADADSSSVDKNRSG